MNARPMWLRTYRSPPSFADSEPMVYRACNDGPCDHGRKPCPSPQACRLPDGERKPGLAVRFYFWVQRQKELQRSDLDGLPWVAFPIAFLLGLLVPWIWNAWSGR
jgi:hypothetical protein